MFVVVFLIFLIAFSLTFQKIWFSVASGSLVQELLIWFSLLFNGLAYQETLCVNVILHFQRKLQYLSPPGVSLLSGEVRKIYHPYSGLCAGAFSNLSIVYDAFERL